MKLEELVNDWIKQETEKKIKEQIDNALALHNPATVFGRVIKRTTWREFSFYHIWIEKDKDFVVLVFIGDMLVGKGENG